jgi:hypothetical protein
VTIIELDGLFPRALSLEAVAKPAGCLMIEEGPSKRGSEVPPCLE